MIPRFNGTTSDEAVDNSLNLTAEAGEGVYRLVKFVRKRNEEEKGAAQAAKSAEHNRVVKDALSYYRGGSFTPENEELIRNLIGQLGGAENIPFAFFGDNGDLSYFWRRSYDGIPAQLSIQEIAGIPDEKVRRRTAQTMARCFIDGLLEYDAEAQVYRLSDNGEKYIYDGDFVSHRLSKEAGEIEEAALSADAEARQAERGFADHNRVTINRDALGTSETEEGLFCRIPNTRGKDFICFPNGTYFLLNEKTAEVYIDPEAQYQILDSGGAFRRSESGAELSKCYEIKQPAKRTAPDAAGAGAKAKDFANRVSTVNAPKAALKSGDRVFAVDIYGTGYALREYRVAYSALDKQSGETVYRLSRDNGEDMIVTESCINKTVFESRETGILLLQQGEGKREVDAVRESFKASKAAGAAAKLDPFTAAVSAVAQVAEKAARSRQQ